MQGERTADRNVIPRWRALAGIDRAEAQSLPRFSEQTHRNLKEDYTQFFPIWKAEDPITYASELFDAFAITQDISLLMQAHGIVKQHIARAPKRLIESINSSLISPQSPAEFRRSAAHRERDESYLRRTIKLLKSRINEFPRDALACLEIARIYTIMGHFSKAENFLHRSRVLAPDDRIILRSTLQFYDVVGDLYNGLKIVRKSSRLQFDPWLQSGEVAASTLLGKTSAVTKLKSVTNLAKSPIQKNQSELAMALATLERQNGVKERQVFQLVKRALAHTTENGFAQAVWLSERSSRDFASRFPDVQPGSDAFEAKLALALEREEFADAAGFAELWLEDQPFSAAALIRLLNIRTTLLHPDDISIAWARRGMAVHGDDWHVFNALVLHFAEAGLFDEAASALISLDRNAPAGLNRAFVDAAEGYLAFSIGEFTKARAAYERALTTTRGAGDIDLVLNCMMFWFKSELRNNLISPSDASQIISYIDKNISRVSKGEASNLNNIWKSIKDIDQHNRGNPSNTSQHVLVERVSDTLMSGA